MCIFAVNLPFGELMTAGYGLDVGEGTTVAVAVAVCVALGVSVRVDVGISVIEEVGGIFGIDEHDANPHTKRIRRQRFFTRSFFRSPTRG
jgi:hypothetical protein